MINGDRIRQAREIAGLTQEQLATACGISQSHIALFEQNLRKPQEDTLKGIALATGFPITFFRRDPAPDFPLGSLLYRRRKSMSSQDRDKIRQTGRLVFEAITEMADRFKRIDLRLPRIVGIEPEEAARITRADLGFSPDTPITHLITRLEKNGVVVVSIPFDIEEHDAFSVWADTDPRTPVVVMTSGKPGDRQRWSVSHELGHLVMHYNYNGSPSELESQANRFAGEFLLPEETARKDLGSGPLTLTILADLKSRWGIAIQALVMRAFQLEIITDGQRRYLFRQLAAKGWLKDEPVLIPQEKPRLLRKLAESIYGPNFDLKSITEPLGVPTQMFRPILNSYASAADLKGSSQTFPAKSRGRLLSMVPRRP
jgi:Zn-dependent peptidase ImmA (M78 family)/transcriptional regulator with XRE-family HTH domain